MDVLGFTLLLHGFCEYCPDFEVVVETCEYADMGASKKAVHDIYCKNQGRCNRIAEHLKAKCRDE